MQILHLNRNSKDFYTLLGPIFGSRIIEQQTHDRFYDDPGKEWFYIPNMGVSSLLGATIKNFWAASVEAADLLIREMQLETPRLHGCVPRIYQEAFEAVGFQTIPFRKNFIEVFYEENNLPGPECEDGTD